MSTATLLAAVLVTGIGISQGPVNVAPKSFHAVETCTGACTATVNVEVSNDNVNFLTLGTITLNGTTTVQDGFASQAQWNYIRGNLTAISGVGAAVTLNAGM